MKLRASLLAISIALTSTSAVYAADLSGLKSAPNTASALPIWAGFYAGINAGGTWGNNSSITDAGYPIYARPGSSATTVDVAYGVARGLSGTRNLQTTAGFIGGAQAGYNRQFDRFVVGFETDFQGVAGGEQSGGQFRAYHFNFFSLGRSTPATNNVLTQISNKKTLDYFGTARAKIGYLIKPELLIYGTGGFAYGGVTLTSSTNIVEIQELTDELGLGYASKSNLLTGWTAGGGAEWMFAQNWSAKAEYLYYDLGGMNMYSGTALLVRNNIGPVGAGTPRGQIGSAASQNVSSRFNGSIARLGVNYHFNFASAPVVAKY
jgi:outer membrane immunogenic protein